MDEERFGTRDLTYSGWHRTDSTKRYIGREKAYELSYIDIDAVEYCRICCQPLLLIELARDVGQKHKNHTVLIQLARKAQVPAAVVLYTIDGDNGISKFRVKNVWPFRDNNWKPYSPQEYTERLWRLREKHECYKLRLSYRPAQGLF